MNNYSKFLDKKIFTIVSKCADKLGYETYVIGGWVRDIVMGRSKKNTDIDFVCVGSGIKLAEEVQTILGNKAKFQIFKKFGTALVNIKNENYEFVGARSESYRTSSRKPIIENGTLQEDQLRRDFTINALAIKLNKKDFGEIIDPFNGKQDIFDKVIVTPLDPSKTFSDDPLRMMRAIRFASELNFNIKKSTLDSIKNNRERLSIVSQERITDEFNKILLSQQPSIGIKLLFKTNLLHIFFKELVSLAGVEIKNNHAHKDNFKHTLQVLDNISKNTDDLWLRWAALLHDIAKPITKRYEEGHGWTFHAHEFIGSKMVTSIFRKLKLPLNDKMKYVKKLVLLHLRPIILAKEIVSDSAIRRLLFDAGNDIEDLMLLCDADITSKNQEKVKKYQNNFQLVRKKIKIVEEKDKIRNFQPPVNGNEVIDLFEISEGKEIGILKNAIKNAILDGKIKNNKKDALKFLKQKANELKIKSKS
tara:strand:- start:55106 stop:56530 length:1425 start_codon:yes stop_codon:yes gene_type:complete